MAPATALVVNTMENLSLSVPDLLQTVKTFVGADKHSALDEMLKRFTSRQLGKQQLQLELRVMVGRDALRQALLVLVPKIDELCEAAAAADGVEVTGERTREQRDAEGRKRAIDLDEDVNKRPRTASTELQTKVAKARSVCTAEVHKRVEELMRPAVADYIVNKIDASELDRRKTAAVAKAESEHAPLSTLDAAYSKYTAAVAARVAAEDEAEKATAAEDAAMAQLQAAVKALVPSSSSGEAGPSGVVKVEQ